MKRALPALVAAFVFSVSPVSAQSPPGAGAQPASPQSRAQAYVAALSSGDPSAFEALAHSAFTPTAAASRTPAQRADMQSHIHSDFGAMQITNIVAEGDHATVEIRGATGMMATLQL